MVQSSSTGDLHQLSIDVLSTQCYRLRPSDTIYPTFIAQLAPGSCELRALLFWSHNACFTRARFLRAFSKLDILCYGRQIRYSTEATSALQSTPSAGSKAAVYLRVRPTTKKTDKKSG
jgi:hypothetical protein